MWMGSMCSLEFLSPTQAAVGDCPQPPVVTEGASSQGGTGRDLGFRPALWGGHTCPDVLLPSFSPYAVGPTRQGSRSRQQSEGRCGPGILPARGPV